jgi:predicted membrane-bound spermidine synthase
MCGLGLGGFAAGRFADARFRADPLAPLRWYGRLELAIGALALALALLLPRLEPLSAWIASYAADAHGWFRIAPLASVARYAIAAALLAPITLLMGATLTLLIRHVVGGEVAAAGWRISLLYAVNTAGAALGCLLTDLVLVPALGVLATQGVAVALNAGAGLGALALASRAAPVPAPDAARPAAPAPAADAGLGRAAALTGCALALTGFASMGMQVVWFRHLVSVLGGYRPVFSILLFAILTGLWVGSVAGSWLDRRVRRPLPLFAASVTLFALGALAALALSEPWRARPEIWLEQGAPADARSDLVWSLAVHGAALGPALWIVGLPIACLGAAFPLANAHVQRLAASVGRRAGLLYLANTAGAVLGSLGAGFVLLPVFGTQRAALILVGAALLSVPALHLAHAADRRASGVPRGRSAAPLFAACYALGLAALVVWSALPPDHLLRRSLPSVLELDVLDIQEGLNETIVVVNLPGRGRALYTNGHSMSSTSLRGQRYMRAFAHIPLLLHERPRTAMVMCFGVGNTLDAALLHPLERVDLVDYSEDVLRHADWFAETNHHALENPRVRVFVNDARQHLRMTPPESYDLITGEPPPIAQAGVVNLYSREFFALARSRLRPGGLLSYWFPIRQVSEETARSVTRSFVEVFPDSVLLSGMESELILLGAVGGAPRVDLGRLAERLAALPAVALDLRSIFMARPQELVGTFVASADTMRRASAGAVPVTDDRPVLEYGAARYARTSGLPADLFDVKGAAQWCPTCFAPREAPAGEGPRSFRAYLSILARTYASRPFLRSRPGQTAALRMPRPKTDAQRIQLHRSLYLRYLFDQAPADYRRALVLLEEGRIEQATQLLEEVVLLLPNPAARATLGQAYLSRGRTADAIQQFELALATAPDLEAARAGLAQARGDGVTRAPARE